MTTTLFQPSFAGKSERARRVKFEKNRLSAFSACRIIFRSRYPATPPQKKEQTSLVACVVPPLPTRDILIAREPNTMATEVAPARGFLRQSHTVVLDFLFDYYQTMFSKSAGGTAIKANRIVESSEFSVVVGIACAATVAFAAVIGAGFFLPLQVALAYCVSLFLVPLAYRVLGRMWVRFCKLLIRSRCTGGQQNLRSKPSARKSFWAYFIGMQLCLVIFFWFASMANDSGYFSESVSLLISVGAFNAICVSVLVTHGVGGTLKHAGYKFYQPFQGGLKFCILQGIGWSLLSVSLVFIVVHLLITSANLMKFCGSCLLAERLRGSSILVGASSTGVLAEVLMACSLLVFNDDKLKKETLSSVKRAFSTPSSLHKLIQKPLARFAAARTSLRPQRPSLPVIPSPRLEAQQGPPSPLDLPVVELGASAHDSKKHILNTTARQSKALPTLKRSLSTTAVPLLNQRKAAAVAEKKPKRNAIRRRGTRRTGVELWGQAHDEALAAAAPLQGSTLETRLRLVSLIPIAAAVAHAVMSSRHATATGWALLRLAGPIVVSIGCALWLLVRILDNAATTHAAADQQTRSKRNKIRGIDGFDYLEPAAEVARTKPPSPDQTISTATTQAHRRRRARRGLGAWDAVDPVEAILPVADDTPARVRPRRRRRRRATLMDGLAPVVDILPSAERNNRVRPRRRRAARVRRHLGLWDSMDAVAEDAAPASPKCPTMRGRVRGLCGWDALRGLGATGEGAMQYGTVRAGAATLRRPRQGRRGARKLGLWDIFIGMGGLRDTGRTATATTERAYSRREKTVGLSNWDGMSSTADLVGRTGSPVGHRRQKRHLGLWDPLSGLCPRQRQSGIPLKQRKGRRLRGLDNLDGLADVADWSAQAPAKKTNRGALSAFDHLSPVVESDSSNFETAQPRARGLDNWANDYVLV